MKTLIVIPVYNDEPSEIEKASLKSISSCVKKNPYDIILIHPKSMHEETLNKYFFLLDETHELYIDNQEFDDEYFSSVESYSKLLKTQMFYESFYNRKADFILIVQTDCWMINLESLEHWVNEYFDYVGSPIMTNKKDWPDSPCCGNGGLSLRKVKKFMELCSNKDLIDKVNSINESFNRYEDVFFCEGMSQFVYIDLPVWEECAMFAWDMNPDMIEARGYNWEDIIGVHAWQKNIPFWKDKLNIPDYIAKIAYEQHKQWIDAYYKKDIYF